MARLTKIWKWLKYVLGGAMCASLIIASSVAGTRGSEIKELKRSNAQKDSVISRLSEVQKAEVECQLNINVKNNKKGVLVIDSKMTAEKIGDAVKEAMNERD